MMNVVSLKGRQRGIATLLILMLVGVAISAAVFGALRFVQGGQNQTMAFHSQTQAQMKAWGGVDIVLSYLDQLIEDGKLQDLLDVVPKKGQGKIDAIGDPDDLDSDLKAVFYKEAVAGTGDTHLYAEITGISAAGTRAESSSTVQVVYLIENDTVEGGSGSCGKVCSDTLFDIAHDLEMKGGITFETDKVFQIRVDGNISVTTGINVKGGGSASLLSSKSISIIGGSYSNLEEFHAGCDVRASRTYVSINRVKAARNACLADTVNTNSVIANGSIEVKGGTHDEFHAHAKPWTSGVCEPEELSCATVDDPFSNLDSDFGVKTSGSTTIKGGIYTYGNVIPLGAIKGGAGLFKIGAAGSVSGKKDCLEAVKDQNEYECDSVNLDDVVDSPNFARPIFNAYSLRNIANFRYYKKVDTGHLRVEIRGIKGIKDSTNNENIKEIRDNGYYYRGARIITGGWSRLVGGYACTTEVAHSSQDEFESGVCLARLGRDHSGSGPLPEYKNEKWIFDGVNHIPGVIFVEGNIEIGNGTYTNTFIATQNIHVTTAWGPVYSLNYAGPNGSGSSPIGVCENNSYPAEKPEDFCGEGGYNSDPYSGEKENLYDGGIGIGNYALLAGSCPLNDDNCSQYEGGDIKVENSVYGIVKAGNLFDSAGDAKIYGAISIMASRADARENAFNLQGGSTTIYWKNLPEYYNGQVCGPNPVCGSDKNSGFKTKVLWTRYM